MISKFRSSSLYSSHFTDEPSESHRKFYKPYQTQFIWVTIYLTIKVIRNKWCNIVYKIYLIAEAITNVFIYFVYFGNIKNKIKVSWIFIYPCLYILYILMGEKLEFLTDRFLTNEHCKWFLQWVYSRGILNFLNNSKNSKTLREIHYFVELYIFQKHLQIAISRCHSTTNR